MKAFRFLLLFVTAFAARSVFGSVSWLQAPPASVVAGTNVNVQSSGSYYYYSGQGTAVMYIYIAGSIAAQYYIPPGGSNVASATISRTLNTATTYQATVQFNGTTVSDTGVSTVQMKPVVNAINPSCTYNSPASFYASGTNVTTWSASGLPAGLSINSSSGLISGTPSAVPGTYSATITGSGVGGSASATATITVNKANFSAPNAPGSSSASVGSSWYPSISGGNPISGTAMAVSGITNWSQSGWTPGTGDAGVSYTYYVANIAPAAYYNGTPDSHLPGYVLAIAGPATVNVGKMSQSVSVSNPGTGPSNPATLWSAVNWAWQTTSFTYDGSGHSPTLSCNTSYAQRGSSTWSATNAGTYTASADATGTPTTTFTVSGSTSRGLGIDSWSYSGPISLISSNSSSATFQSTGGGSCSVTATSNGNSQVAPSSGTAYFTIAASNSSTSTSWTIGRGSNGANVIISGVSPSGSGATYTGPNLSSVTLQAGIAYTFTASGGIYGYSWGGAVTGSGATKTVTFPNTGTYTISVCDPGDSNHVASAAASCTITVGNAPVISSSLTASATVGTAFSYTITASGNPTSFDAVGLPGGLTVTPNTGVISGTPTTPGNYTVTLKATNSTATGTADLKLTITATKPVINSPATAYAPVGNAFTYQITATNTPISYAATGLPSWLTINTSTGAVSGTPTEPGNYSFSVTAANSAGQSDPLTVTVAAPTQLDSGSVTLQVSAIAKGSGYVRTTINGYTYEFDFNGSSDWAVATNASYVANIFGVSRGAQYSATVDATVSDYVIKIQSAYEESPYIAGEVVYNDMYSDGIAKADVAAGTFQFRFDGKYSVPFGQVDTSRWEHARAVVFGMGTDTLGQSAGFYSISDVGFVSGSTNAPLYTRYYNGPGTNWSYYDEPGTATADKRWQAISAEGLMEVDYKQGTRAPAGRYIIKYFRGVISPPASGPASGGTLIATYTVDCGSATGSYPAPTSDNWTFNGANLISIDHDVPTPQGDVHRYVQLRTDSYSLQTVEVPATSWQPETQGYDDRTVMRRWPWSSTSGDLGALTKSTAKLVRYVTINGSAGTSTTTIYAGYMDRLEYAGSTDDTTVVSSVHESYRNEKMEGTPLSIVLGEGADSQLTRSETDHMNSDGTAIPNSSDHYKWAQSIVVDAHGGKTFNASFYYDNLGTQPAGAFGKTSQTRRSFLDNDIGSSNDLVTTYTYTPVGDGVLTLPSSTVTKQGSTVIADEEASYQEADDPQGITPPILTATVNKYASSGVALTTITKRYSPRTNNADYRDRLISEQRPDGSKTSYGFERGSLSGSVWTASTTGAMRRVVETTGKVGSGVTQFGTIALDALDLDAGRSTVSEKILDEAGNLVREAVYVYMGPGDFRQLTIVYNGYDDQDHLVIRADQPINLANQPGRILYRASYTGFVKDYEIGEDGTKTTFTYDDYLRVATSTRVASGTSGQDDYIAPLTTTYTYEGPGSDRITRTEVSSGTGTETLVTSTAYDTQNRVKSVTAPGGYVTATAYDSATQITVRTNGNDTNQTEIGNKVTQLFKDGRPKSESGSAVPDVSYTYAFDASGFLTVTKTFTAGPWTGVTTDWLRRPVTESAPTYTAQTRTKNSIYNSAGQLTRVETRLGTSEVAPAVVFEYDAYGRQTKSAVTTRSASGFGAIDPSSDYDVKQTDAVYQAGAPGIASSDLYLLTTTQVWPYDGANRSVSRYAAKTYTQVSGLTATSVAHTIAYDIDLNRSEATTTATYSEAKRVTDTTVTGSTATLETVTRNGLTVQSTNAQGLTTKQKYDALSRPSAEIDPRIGATTTTYVPGTTLVQQTVTPDNLASTVGYDIGGRVQSKVDSAGKHAYFAYDAAGNLTYQWGETVDPVWYEYDDLNRRTKMHTYRTGTFTASAFPTASFGTGDVTTWGYDPSTGLLVSKTDASGVAFTYEYNVLGQMSKRTDGRSRVTNYLYEDPRKLLTHVQYTDGVTPDVYYSYDRAGRKASVTDAMGTRSFGYYDTWTDSTDGADLLNKSARLHTETLPSGWGSHVVQYTHQYLVANRANGPIAGVSLDTGSVYNVSYGYDAVLRFGSATYNTAPAFVYTYVPNSNLVDQVTQSGGYQRDYDYQPNSNRLDTLKHLWAGSLNSQSKLTYEPYRPVRMQEKTQSAAWLAALGRTSESGVDAEYAYNDRYELTSSGKYVLNSDWSVGSARPNTACSFDYDNIGNRLSDRPDKVADYVANNLNQYTTAPLFGTFTYDGNGNLTGDGMRTYEYDAENRLTKVTRGTSYWTYTYDYLGRRVQTVDSTGTTTKFVYDGWNVIAELNGSGTITRRYAWGLDVSGTLQGAGGVGGLLVVDAGAQYTVVYDGSHNVIGLWDASGNYAAAYEYDPYGNLQTVRGAMGTTNPFRSATKYTDGSGLVYYGRRHYLPSLGRFVNRDPIEERGGLNLYAFCGNDGVNRYDYLGESMLDYFRPWWDTVVSQDEQSWAAANNAASLDKENNGAAKGANDEQQGQTTGEQANQKEITSNAPLDDTAHGARSDTANADKGANAYKPDAKNAADAKEQKTQSRKPQPSFLDFDVGLHAAALRGGAHAASKPSAIRTVWNWLLKPVNLGPTGNRITQAFNPAFHLRNLSAIMDSAADASSELGNRLLPGSGRNVRDAFLVGSMFIGPGELKVFSRAEEALRLAAESTTTVFRVESAANARVLIGDGGSVATQGDNMLFLNFGDEARAQSFLARRLEQGYEGTTIKSFEVPTSFVDQLRADSVLENEAHLFPDAPLQVDLQFPDQFGLRASQIERLNHAIIQGTGKVY